MDDEFKLCWKNFQDNIASGFQNLYDRGDLVDVTLACDGKLLHAHKIVLAICSPYFQEIFSTNPCKHPIIILKDVTFNIMCELLEFMYQGVVNVKHTELQSFMKIGQLLQIKGLATNPSSSSTTSTSSDKSASHNVEENGGNRGNGGGGGGGNPLAETSPLHNHSPSNNKNNNNGEASNVDANSNNGKPSANSSTPTPTPTTTRSESPTNFSSLGIAAALQGLKASNDSSIPLYSAYHAGSLKRPSDFCSDALSIYSRKQFRRSIPSLDHSSDPNDGGGNGGGGNTGMDGSVGGGVGGAGAGGGGEPGQDEFFLPGVAHISMMEPRYDLSGVKREGGVVGGIGGGGGDHHSSPAAALRNSFGSAAFNFDYNNLYKNNSSSNSGSGQEYPNELHMPNDYSKNFGNHMDIPQIAPGEHWFQGKLEFMLSQRGKPLLVHDGHTFGIQYVRKDKKYWQCNLSRKFNCKARVTTTDTGEIIVTNNEHCHTEIRQHLRKDYQRNKVMLNALMNLSTNRLAENMRRHSVANSLSGLGSLSSMGGMMHHSANISPLSSPADMSEHHGLLDLGKKTRQTLKTPELQEIDRAKTQTTPQVVLDDEDDDDDRPLDCGIRSANVNLRETSGVSEHNDRPQTVNDYSCKEDECLNLNTKE